MVVTSPVMRAVIRFQRNFRGQTFITQPGVVCALVLFIFFCYQCYQLQHFNDYLWNTRDLPSSFTWGRNSG